MAGSNNVRMTLSPSVQAEAATGLTSLSGMNESELKALAEAVVSLNANSTSRRSWQQIAKER